MSKIKVLLVDDHLIVREGLRVILGTAPDIDIVAEAGDGLEALDKAVEFQPNVVLMDIHMPKLDGIEATRRIKNSLPATSVIVITMYDNDAFVVDAVRAGAGGYLLKDTSKDLLIHAIRAVNSGGMLVKTSLLREVLASSVDLPSAHHKVKTAGNGAFDELTDRERDVLRLLVQGRSNKDIGQVLYIAEDTVKKHVQTILAKLGVSDRTQAAVKAVRSGLVEYTPDADA